MNISILSPNSMKEEQMRRDIIKNLARNKIHIASIRETHIAQDGAYLLYNYRAIAAAAAKKEKTGGIQGGTEITIDESMQKYITKITCRRSRVLRVTLRRKNSNMPIQILTTYAPNNGHAE